MNPTRFRYFHYFIALLCFDLCVIYSIGLFFGAGYLHFITGLWVISNFINYPRIASRRFISYYQIMTLTIKQFATFLAFGALCLMLFFSFEFGQQLFAPLVVLAAFISRFLFVFILRLYRIIGRGYNRFYMIGDSPIMTDIKTRFLTKKSHGFIFEGQSESIDLDQLRGLIIHKQLNEIYCSSQSVNQDELTKLLGLALHYGINIHVISDMTSKQELKRSEDDSFLFYSEIDLEDFPLIDRKNLIIKRFFDIVFSSLIILTILWWISIILWIVIKLETNGPLFFKQPRAGREGKYFMCYKFRSMRISSIEKQATKNDQRITRVGKIIRRLSIDELPQFMNVLLGQMSVVGPRPHIKLLNDKYGSEIDHYDHRMLVKPGITGLSQISGLRGETLENATMANRVKVDMVYIKTWSLHKDLTIIVRTIFDLLFLRHKNVF